MENLFRNLLACSVLALAMCTVLAAQDAGPSDALSLDCKSMTVDRQTNLLECDAPAFAQGDVRIRADRAQATSTDFEQRGDLRFVGHVRITLENASFEADSAAFTFEHNQLLQGAIDGSPASFTGIEASTQRPVTAEATKFEYDNVARKLRMAGDARIVRENNQDRYEIRGCDLIYDFDAERVSSGSTDCPEPFRFRKLPPADQQPATPASPQ